MSVQAYQAHDGIILCAACAEKEPTYKPAVPFEHRRPDTIWCDLCDAEIKERR